MSTDPGKEEFFQNELKAMEIITGLHHALDQHYRRLCDAARTDWERLFGKDPADACVSVRIEPTPTTATRGSGFLKSRRQPEKPDPKNPVPRLAH